MTDNHDAEHKELTLEQLERKWRTMMDPRNAVYVEWLGEPVPPDLVERRKNEPGDD